MLTRRTTTLRPADLSEAAVIAGMSRLQIEHGLRWRWTPTRVRIAINDADTMVLVASLEGIVIGFAIMKFGDTDAHLYLLAVEPHYRRGGVARELLRWLEASCRTAGLGRIHLEVRKNNLNARRFYERQGYAMLGQIPDYYDQTEDALLLGKTLGYPDKDLLPR